MFLLIWNDQKKPNYLVAQMVKNLPAMGETWVRSLGWEDTLKEGMETHSSILAWRIPWTEEPDGLQLMWLQRVRRNWATKNTHIDRKQINGYLGLGLGINSKQAYGKILKYRYLKQTDLC